MSDMGLWRAQRTTESDLERLRKADVGGVVVAYTPTYLGSTVAGATTYTLQAGFYTRVGNLVTCWGAVVWTAATGTGNALISLPIAATATASANFSGSVRCSSVTFANSTPQVQFAASQTSWQMLSPITNGGGATVAVEAAGNLIWTITYAVD